MNRGFYNDNLIDFLINRSIISSIAYQNLDLASFKDSIFSSKYTLDIKKYFSSAQYQKMYALLSIAFYLCVETTNKIHDKKSAIYKEIKLALDTGEKADAGGRWINRGIYVFLIYFRCYYDFYVLHKICKLHENKSDFASKFQDEFGFILKIGEIYEAKIKLMASSLKNINENLQFYDNIIDSPMVFKKYIIENYKKVIENFAFKIPPMNKDIEKYNIFEWRKTLKDSIHHIESAYIDKITRDENGQKQSTESVINKNEILFPNLLYVFKEKLLNLRPPTQEKLKNIKDFCGDLNYNDKIYLIPYLISKNAYCDLETPNSGNGEFCYLLYIRSPLIFMNGADNERNNGIGLISNYFSALIMEMILRNTSANENNAFKDYKNSCFFIDFFSFYFENGYSAKITKNNEVFENIAKTNFQFNNALPLDTIRYPAFIYQRLMTDYFKDCLDKNQDTIREAFVKLNEWLKIYRDSGEMPNAEVRQEALIKTIYTALQKSYFPINFDYYSYDKRPTESLMRLDVRIADRKNKENDEFFKNCNAEILTKLSRIILSVLQDGGVLKN